MSFRQLCRAAFALQALLLPFSLANPVDRNAIALRDLGIPIARSVHPLRQAGKRRSKDITDGAATSSETTGSGPAREVFDGSEYIIDIEFGGQTYGVLFDTGSSAFWFPRANFTCLDFNSTVQPQSACNFASYAPDEYSGGQVENQNLNITYGGGEFAIGSVGREDVTFAGLTVKNQHLGLADRSYFVSANGFLSGIMGWGLGNYTSYYPGNDPSADNKTDPNHTWIPTNTWIMNAVEQGLIEKPIFSVNLGNRTENPANLTATGFVAVGGAPLDGLPYTGVWASSSVLPETYSAWGLDNKYTHWNVRPDGFLIDDTFVSWKPGNFIEGPEIFTLVDTGTAWTYITNETVQMIAGKMQPPAYWSHPDTAYVNLCNATVPKVSIRINGTDLPLNKREVLLDGYAGQYYNSTTLCWLGLQPAYQQPRGGTSPYLLGATFLRNFLTVHDLGNLKLSFAALDWS